MKDLPDYTREMVIRYEGGFIGLEELAARLGSIVPWDMKGNIVLMEDFESELTEWTLSATGTEAVATRQSRHKFSGDWAIRLEPGTGVSDWAYLCRDVYYPGLTKYAIFTRIAWASATINWELRATFEDMGVETWASIKYDLSAQTLSVKTESGVWQEIATGVIISSDTFVFHPILLIVDLVNNRYDKLYLDDTEYDLSTYTLSSADNLARTRLEVLVATYGPFPSGYPIYVDDIIIAKNVP